MTQKDKELLLKDLCARLLYGVKVQYAFDEGCGTHRQEVGILEGFYPKKTSIDGVDFILKIDAPYGTYSLHYESWAIKPYLRPMSSMTEEEESEYLDIKKGECDGCVLTGKGDPNTEFMLIDFYNKHHFDYRGLIEKGLAIAVTEENNPYKD